MNNQIPNLPFNFSDTSRQQPNPQFSQLPVPSNSSFRPIPNLFPSVPRTNLPLGLPSNLTIPRVPSIPPIPSNLSVPRVPSIPPIPSNLPVPRVPQVISNIPVPRAPRVSFNLPTPKIPSGSRLPSIPIIGQSYRLPPVNVIPSIPGYVSKSRPDTQMIMEDTYKVLVTPWTEERVVRIGTIGEGSCFFHAYVKGYYGPYQDSTDSRWKMNFIANLRRDLGYGLSTIDDNWDGNVGSPTYPDYLPEEERTYYNKYFATFGEIDPSLSLNVLSRNISNPSFCVGDEVYQYVADILGIGLIVFELNEYGLRLSRKYNNSSNFDHKYVCVINVPGHYELIGVERDINGEMLFQTIFDENDEFIQNIETFDLLSRESSNLRNRIDDVINMIGDSIGINRTHQTLSQRIKSAGRYEYASDVIRNVGWDNFILYLTNAGVNVNDNAIANYLTDIRNLNDQVIELLGNN
jgi:hypothetical protein